MRGLRQQAAVALVAEVGAADPGRVRGALVSVDGISRLDLAEPPSHTALEFRVGGIQLDDGRRSAMDRVLNRASLDQLFRSAAPNDWKKQQGLIVTADRPEC